MLAVPRIDADIAAVRRYRGTDLPATVDQWDTLAAAGIGIAAPGEAEMRRERHSKVEYPRGMSTPDGGHFDRTYGEVEAMSAGPDSAGHLKPLADHTYRQVASRY